MNIAVVLLYANEAWFDISSAVTLTTGLSLHTRSATHRDSLCNLFMFLVNRQGVTGLFLVLNPTYLSKLTNYYFAMSKRELDPLSIQQRSISQQHHFSRHYLCQTKVQFLNELFSITSIQHWHSIKNEVAAHPHVLHLHSSAHAHDLGNTCSRWSFQCMCPIYLEHTIEAFGSDSVLGVIGETHCAGARPWRNVLLNMQLPCFQDSRGPTLDFPSYVYLLGLIFVSD